MSASEIQIGGLYFDPLYVGLVLSIPAVRLYVSPHNKHMLVFLSPH